MEESKVQRESHVIRELCQLETGIGVLGETLSRLYYRLEDYVMPEPPEEHKPEPQTQREALVAMAERLLVIREQLDKHNAKLDKFITDLEA